MFVGGWVVCVCSWLQEHRVGLLLSPCANANAAPAASVAATAYLIYLSSGKVWSNSLTVVVIDPKRKRGGGSKPTGTQVGVERETERGGTQQTNTLTTTNICTQHHAYLPAAPPLH